MKLFAVLLLAAPLSGDAGCSCKETPANPKQTAAEGKPEYVGTQAAYGWGCKAHDSGEGTCKTATDTGNGEPNDWCLDQWCIVDPNTCDQRSIEISYTAADDYFSYEVCDQNFAGNGWAGRCKNCEDKPNSFCSCGGMDGCKCKVGAPKKTAATGKPAYVGEVPAYGSGCKAHDKGHDSCSTANDTGVGQPSDWCLDKWCIVDKDSCKFKTTASSYTAADDYFSYEACDSGFVGNGFVGRCKSCGEEHPDSYCVCDADVNSASKTGLGAVGAALLVAVVFA